MGSNYDLIIKNGNVVLENKVETLDIAIKDGKIVQIGKHMDVKGEVIDAENSFVLPGMIDVHVHFSEPGREHWEGFVTGSHALAKGGCTTFFDMPLNGIPSTINVPAFHQKGFIGEEKSVINFGLWGGLVPGNLEELAGLAEKGVIGFKAFLSPTGTPEFENVDDLTLMEGMKKIAKANKVLALHSESGDLVSRLAEEKISQGKFSADDYSSSRPVIAEVEAVSRALVFAEETGCSIHFVHISSAKAVDLITEAKRKGLDISVETCPHYLWFNQSSLVDKGAVAKCAPPLRVEAERKSLWEKVSLGEIDMISSDHSPCPTEDKEKFANDYFKAWGGISGGQSSLEAFFDKAYYDYNLSLPQIAKLTAENAAKRFGLFPDKGMIREGSDADLVILNPDINNQCKQEDLLYKHPHSPYVGETFRCKVTHTICHGNLVYEQLKNKVFNNRGKWLKVISGVREKNGERFNEY
ncbi:allantoinase AllB [Aquibacillus albus]|uniref:Allantoinase n=1 Tax=Aquibacillus albus TaxID=1168171 RepID=A0ABS2MVX5_9BACI|nr:allantoinase AllB [Aquibacillus albus]MBM7570041.1 allantoinase [Aquibacillus albus]